MRNRLINKVLKRMGYVRKEVVVKKLRQQKEDLIALEEIVFELKCERQSLIMELQCMTRENQLLSSSLEDERIKKVAAVKSLEIAKQVMKKDKALKKVFGGEN